MAGSMDSGRSLLEEQVENALAAFAKQTNRRKRQAMISLTRPRAFNAGPNSRQSL